MSKPHEQHSWSEAILHLARSQEIPFPGFQTTGMGNARSLPIPSGRFVTMKRRLVSLAEAQRDGVEFTLWQDQADFPTQFASFRESSKPAASEVDRAFAILKGWLIDESPAEAAQVMVNDHPRRSPVTSAVNVEATTQEYWLADGMRLGFLVRPDGWSIESQGECLTSWRTKDSDHPHHVLDLESLDRLCAWLAEQWSVVAFGSDSRPDELREGAVAASRAYENAELSRAIARDDTIRDWWSRHAVRAADSRLPNLFLERQGDSFIVSWDASPTTDRFYSVQPGERVCPIPIAVPVLRQLLEDRRQARKTSPIDHAELADLPATSAQAGYQAMCRYDDQIDPTWLFDHGFGERDAETFAITGATRHPIGGLLRSGQGGSLTRSDYDAIFRSLRKSQSDSYLKLRELDRGLNSGINSREPWESGYHLATTIRTRLGFAPMGYLDIEQVLQALPVAVKDVPFHDDAILGACVGTPGYAPLILINPRCPDASGPSGRRMTLAHELSHLLFDRAGFRNLARFEGGSADGDRLIEMRANAFAVELLVPRMMLIGDDGQILSETDLKRISIDQGVSFPAVKQHADNLRNRLAMG